MQRKKITILIPLLLIFFSYACKKDKELINHNLQEVVGNYCITCKGHQVLYLPGPNQDRYRSVDTIFRDTLIIIEDTELTFEGTPFQILKAQIKQYPYAQTSLFRVVKIDRSNFSFPALYNGYECKCNETIEFEQDSVFFHFHNVWMEDSPNFNCRGIKKN